MSVDDEVIIVRDVTGVIPRWLVGLRGHVLRRHPWEFGPPQYDVHLGTRILRRVPGWALERATTP